MRSVYVVSTHEKSKLNMYKIGKHTGTLRKLESRYTTSLINPIVYFFYPTTHASIIETEIKKQLDSDRIVNDNETKTEWVHLELKLIINTILDISAGMMNNTKKFIGPAQLIDLTIDDTASIVDLITNMKIVDQTKN